MDLCLRDDVAVVVGGASGIGRAIATAFLAEGERAAVFDIAVPTAADDRSASFQADVADCAAVMRAANEVRSRFGRVDHVVFAAGVGSGKFGFPFWKLDPADWDRVLRINLVGAATSPMPSRGLAEQKRGTMLFLASVAGQMGSQTDPPIARGRRGSSTS